MTETRAQLTAETQTILVERQHLRQRSLMRAVTALGPMDPASDKYADVLRAAQELVNSLIAGNYALRLNVEER